MLFKKIRKGMGSLHQRVPGECYIDRRYLLSHVSTRRPLMLPTCVTLAAFCRKAMMITCHAYLLTGLPIMPFHTKAPNDTLLCVGVESKGCLAKLNNFHKGQIWGITLLRENLMTKVELSKRASLLCINLRMRCLRAFR